ncbi:hypothetical protein DIS24_g12064 [Lasiodiplodia hormozganensis]|uniref:Aminoglycoside phosphotransferase domain-containing protein n=1 Tax=Lasiodiplodia hormozganensis TaxID=869390 RepID=A0AA39TRG6_9PEZI|nr:hypothetical protein DIS24_g12064 [Lasiodiplodia hormozganensis]
MSDPAIPSIPEIRKSAQVLSAPDALATVVKVGDFAVKFGPSVTMLEAENLEYVSKNSKVPAPKFFTAFTEPETKSTFIVMEHVDGVQLEDIWKSLTPSEKLDVGKQIQTAVENLRTLQPPGYLRSVRRQAFADAIFYLEEPNSAVQGPFESEDEMNEAMIQKMAQYLPQPSQSLMRTLMSTTLRGHKTTFTHGDLQPKNIMVRRTGTRDDDTGIFEIKILDWEVSGWYPEYWEFCKSTVAGFAKPDWLELVQQIMQIYPNEYLMMESVRKILFW